MSDDDKKDPKMPDPDEFRKTIEGMFGQMGKSGFTFPGMEGDVFTREEDGDATVEVEEDNTLFEFDYLPRDIKAHLDRYVIRQDEAKKALAIAVCDHYNHAKALNSMGEDGERLELQKQNVMVVGPTGAGKSVLLSLLALQFRRYEQAQVFLFDKGASARCATLALGGTWYDLGLEGDLAFQPLRDVDGEGGLAAAQAWVLGLIEQEGVTVTPEVKQAVWTALQSLGAAPVAQRTLTGLVALLQIPDLRQALEPYTLAGPYGALLDADEVNLEAGDVLCFEMEALMQDKRLAAPVLAHLFTKLEARFDGRPTMLILDEAWLFLDHPMFSGRLRDWLKTLRKKNVSVVFATQSLSDIAASSIAPSLIESAPTRIFLANARAEEPSQRAAYEGFGLNARQVELIARATPKRDYYVQTPDGNRLFDLDLGPVALAFCAAGTKADQKLISEILASVGPEGFAPAWLSARGLHWAADLIAAEGEMPCAAEWSPFCSDRSLRLDWPPHRHTPCSASAIS